MRLKYAVSAESHRCYERALRMRYKLTTEGEGKAYESWYGVGGRIRRFFLDLIPTKRSIGEWVLRWLLAHPNGMSIERLHFHTAGWMDVGDLYHEAIIPLKRLGYIQRVK